MSEVSEAREWYERHRAGLGDQYLEQLERVLSSISENPEQFGLVERDVRVAILKRFPYAVYYRLLEDRIRVLAIYHVSRDSSAWLSRE